jgi:N-methylhydantoinase A/oxoprolinase/acetone carboxylase beta subunit
MTESPDASARELSGLAIAIDVGGTFTDVVGMTAGGRMALTKVPSTPDDPSRGVVTGLRALVAEMELSPADAARFIHGTTVATNAVVEQKGAVTGLVTTEGFEDVLTVGRQKRSELYNLFIDPETPEFLVPRRRRYGIPERVAADGTVLKPLDEAAVRAAVRELRDVHKVQAIAVCYLFSFLEPRHEVRTAEIIAEEAPGIKVSLSSSIDPTFREYERTLVTTVDAYLRPKVASYIGALDDQLKAIGVPAQLEIMQSRGGIVAASSAMSRPVSLLRSGPAAGVVAAQLIGEVCGEKNLISNDIGGTTADLGVIVDGKPLTSTEGKVLKYPVRIPMIDVTSIGAGGGSIAWIDEAMSLHVGPHSAGSVPGPVCYGTGGTEPTVTDASVVMGYLNPAYFAGGGVKLDPEASHRVLEGFGGRIGMTKAEVAGGIHTILNNRMADEIRLLTVARGYDPREFSLVMLGGAGPLHGGSLARMLRIPRVIIPFAPGVLSAFGLLVSDVEHDNAASFRRPAVPETLAELGRTLAELDRAGREDMARDKIDPGRVGVRRYAEMRYVGQSYELEVPVEGEIDERTIASLTDSFQEVHERVYRQRNPGAIEFVNLRTVHFAAAPKLVLDPPKPGPSWEAAQTGTRKLYIAEAGAYVDTPVFHRAKLPVGTPRKGPFIVEQIDSTAVVFPGETAKVEENGNIILDMPGHG